MVRLLRDEPERCVAAAWDAGQGSQMVVELDVVARDRDFLLSDVMKVLREQQTGSLKVEAHADPGGTAHIHLRLSVANNDQLELVRSALTRVESVTDVLRPGRGNGVRGRNGAGG